MQGDELTLIEKLSVRDRFNDLFPAMATATQSFREKQNVSVILLYVLICLSLLIRFAYLSYPSQVVFDEVGFGKFVTAYGWTGERFFDIHPPHGKLLITAVAKIGGYHGSINFANIGNVCAESIAPLRFLPALASSLIPALVYILLFQLGASNPAAFLGAVLITFDNAFVVQSRVIGLDMILIFFILSSLSALLASGTSEGVKKMSWIALSGMTSGLAVGTKFTGLAAVALAIVILLDRFSRNKTLRLRLQDVFHFGIFVGAATGIYLLGWVIHFHLLNLPGSGDAFFVPAGRLIQDTINLNHIMLNANAGIKATHPYSSFWWQWPMMVKPIYYWANGNNGIYLLGNPVLWWGVGGVFTWLMGYLIFGRARNITTEHIADKSPMLWAPIAGYLISIIPLVPVDRPLFLYHYLPSLTFSLLASVLWLDVTGFVRQTTIFKQRIGYYGIIGFCILMFTALTPITFGVSCLSQYQKILGWIRFGP